MKKEQKYLNPESNNRSTNKLINNPFPFEELKSIQRSNAMQQQTLNKILNLLESLRATTNLRFNGGL